MDVAALEHHLCVAEYEIHSAGDVAVDEKLTTTVDVKGVLVAQHVTLIEC